MTRSIPISVTTGSLYPLPTLESIQRLSELGMREIELTLQPGEFHLTFERALRMPILPELTRLVKEEKLRIHSIHAPAIFHAHANHLWARTQYILHAIEVCSLLGASVLVVHPLHLLQHQESALEYLSGNGTSLFSALLPGVKEITDKAYSENVTLAMENIQDWVDELFFNTPANMSKFLQEMNHPAMGCTLDIMHAQFPGVLDEFISSLSNEIVNIHAADLFPPAKRTAIGKGVIDWPHLVPKLQNLPSLRQITVELGSPTAEDITGSVKLLSDLMS